MLDTNDDLQRLRNEKKKWSMSINLTNEYGVK